MANRQDSGSNSAHQNQRPTSHNEDAIPEIEEARGHAADEDESEFDDSEDLDDEEEDEENEGSF